MPNWPLRHISVEMLKDEDGVGWTADPLRMHYAFRLDEKTISSVQAIKLSKIADISIVTAQ